MISPFRKKTLLLAFLILRSVFLFATGKEDSTKAVIAWLKNNIIPVQDSKSGRGYPDLQPFKQVFRDVELVGLGEASHGTSQFFQLKQHIVEFLVREMGYTAIALESSMSGCSRINEYILYGKGDLPACLADQGYMAWDTQEMITLLLWLRNYNETAPEEKKVRIYGIDLHFNAIARKGLLDYIHQFAPAVQSVADSVFDHLNEQDSLWPFQLNKDSLAALAPPMQVIAGYFQQHRDELIRVSTKENFEKNLDLLENIRMDMLVSIEMTESGLRDRFMAEHILSIKNKLKPGSKVIVWAHNVHVSFDTVWTGTHTMGYYLKEKYGHGYFACGFDFFEGSYQARYFLAGQKLSPPKEFSAPASPPEAGLGWLLHQTWNKTLFLDLSQKPSDELILSWMNKPVKMHDMYWINDFTKEGFVPVILRNSYDGIFFVDRISGSHPTGTPVTMNRF